MSGYLVTKAGRLLKVGVEIYRKSDALAQPEEGLSAARIETITRAAQQLIEGKGFIETAPLSKIGIEGFYDLVRTFHFEVCHQEAVAAIGKNKILDKMTCRHLLTEQKIILFNLVDRPLSNFQPTASGRDP